MFALTKRAKQLCIAIGIQIELFNKLVTPILTFNCEVWGYQEREVESINKIHLRFLRFVLRLNNRTPPPDDGETGEVPLKMMIK